MGKRSRDACEVDAHFAGAGALSNKNKSKGIAAAEGDVHKTGADERAPKKSKSKKVAVAEIQDTTEDVAEEDIVVATKKKADAEQADEQEHAPRVKKKKTKLKMVAAVERDVNTTSADEHPQKKSKKSKKAAMTSVIDATRETAEQEIVAPKKKKAADINLDDQEQEPTAKTKKRKRSEVIADTDEKEHEATPIQIDEETKLREKPDETLIPKAVQYEQSSDALARNMRNRRGDWNDRDTENTVLVRGLPYTTTEDVLSNDFAECGEMLSCRMLYNSDGQCKGVAFIKYANQSSCDKAIEFDGTIYAGRTIYVAMAGGTSNGKGKGKGNAKGKESRKGVHDSERTVFIRGLPFSTTEKLLKKDFAECGDIDTIKMPLDAQGQCKGTAFIKYAQVSDCTKALKYDGTEYGGRTIYVIMAEQDACKGKSGKSNGKDAGKTTRDNENTVCVRGLSYSANVDMVKKDFSECGAMISFTMPLDSEGSCRGFAFIKYDSKDACSKAIEYDSTEYGGRKIHVSMAGANDGKGKGSKGNEISTDRKGSRASENKGKAGLITSAALEDPVRGVKATGAMVESTGTKVTFSDSDDE